MMILAKKMGLCEMIVQPYNYIQYRNSLTLIR